MQTANHINKYLDMPKIFYSKAVDTEIAIRQNARTLKDLVSKARNDEQLSDFLLKVAETNDKILDLLEWQKNFLQEIANDAKAMREGAEMRNQLRDSWQTIEFYRGLLDDYAKSLKK